MRRAMLLTLILLAQTEAAPTTTVHAPAVVQAYLDGVDTCTIAHNVGCSRRWVQQIVVAAGLLPRVLPVHPDLVAIVTFEMARHGPNYGRRMLLGALRAHYPGWRWSRHAVAAVMRPLPKMGG